MTPEAPAAASDQGARDRVFHQFPTTVLWRTHPNAGPLNAALGRLVRRLRDAAANAAAGTSTVGGFQTDNEFLKLDDPAIRQLRGLLNAAVQAFLGPYLAQNLTRPPQSVEAELWGWAVLMRRSDYNMPHVHPDAHVSGVYYVEVPEVPAAASDEIAPGGSLVFFDPRGSAEMFRLKHHRTHHSFIPTPGSLIIFPSYHRHAVFPYRSDAERISIAFNARLNMR
jgi:uncharacterized protein (TIGR02466 family)